MKRFSLEEEEKCKAVWQPWFKAGGWDVQLFTRRESAEFQIADVIEKLKNADNKELVRSELLKYCKALKFPHDGEACRGRFLFCFDFKLIRRSHLGNYVEKTAYIKYLSWHKPYFYLLIWANDEEKRYIHQIRNPEKYKSAYMLPSHYDITEDCEEIKIPDAPIKFPKPTEDLSVRDSYALIFAANRWADNEFEGEFQINANDEQRANELLNNSSRRILRVVLRKARLMRKAG